MKKTIILVCLLFLASSAMAQTAAPTFGVGANVGLTYPIVQEDQDNGSIFGLKIMYSLGGITVEPNLSFVKYGEPSLDDFPGLYDGFEGSKITSFGVDGILGGGAGAGMHPYFLFGASIYKTKNDVTDQDSSDLGFAGGLGLEFGMGPALSLDARAKLHVIPTDGGGSKKSATATAGVNFYFGN